MKELEPMGKQHVVEKAAHTRRSLASLSLKICRIERRSVGDGSVMLGVFGHRTKQADKRLCQHLAEVRSYAHGLQGFAAFTQLPQFDSLIKRHAQHGIAGFEFVDLHVEKPVLFLLGAMRASHL